MLLHIFGPINEEHILKDYGSEPLICHCTKRLCPLETWMILFVLFPVSFLWLLLLCWKVTRDYTVSWGLSICHITCVSPWELGIRFLQLLDGTFWNAISYCPWHTLLIINSCHAQCPILITITTFLPLKSFQFCGDQFII